MERFDIYYDRDDFMDKLLSIEEKTKWNHEIPVTDLTFHEEDQAESKLSVSFASGMTFRIRRCALPTVYDRCAISGESLRKMSGKDLAEILNKAARTRNRRYCMIIIVDEQISAILSEGNSEIEYSVLKASDVFSTVQSAIWDLTDEEERSFSGAWSYEGIHAVWDTNLQKEVGGENYSVSVRLSTSDIGRGAICLAAELRNPAHRIPLMDDLKVVHRNVSSINDVNEAVSMLEMTINESLAAIGMLSRIPVNNPVNTMKRLARKVKLPKADALRVISEYEAAQGNASATALDCYKTLSDVLVFYEAHQNNPVYVQTCASNILKLAGADWIKNDLPGTFCW